MKAAFTYTAIGILIVVVLLQIYYMREGFFTSSADKLSALNKAIALCGVSGNRSDCKIAAGSGGDLSNGTNTAGAAMSLDSSDKHKCNSADPTMNDNTYLTNVIRISSTNATILTALTCIKAGFTAATAATAATTAAATTAAATTAAATTAAATTAAATTAAATTAAAKDASGNTVDASGNMITMSLSDLFYALRFNTSGSSSSSSETTYDNLRDDLSKMSSTNTTYTMSEEDKNRLSKDIAKSIKDQILSDRSLQPVIPASTDSCANESACVSDSCSQGADYMSGAPFNANDYIRKDSIPCYGCTLPK